jgi:hypothetical protein
MKLSPIACALFFALVAFAFTTNASGLDDTKNGVIGKMDTPVDAAHGAVTHRRQHGLITSEMCAQKGCRPGGTSQNVQNHEPPDPCLQIHDRSAHAHCVTLHGHP